MGYSLPPDVEQLVRGYMDSGQYSSEDDVLRDALRALAAARTELVYDDPEAVAGVARGLEQMKQGLGERAQVLARLLRAAIA